MAESVLNGLSSDASRIPSNVSRKTVADGSWLQKYTFGKLSARDVYLASAIDDSVSGIDKDIETLAISAQNISGNLNELTNYVHNLSPLTYQGSKDTTGLKDSPQTSAKNGWVFSITGITGKGEWFYPKNEGGFYVKNGDEVAWVSGTNKWFPIGQDIHVEYNGSEYIGIGEYGGVENSIYVQNLRLLTTDSPITGNIIDNAYHIGFDSTQITADYVSADVGNTNNRALVSFYPDYNKLYYYPDVQINSTGLFSPNISSTNITALTSTGNSAKYTNISGTTGTINNVTATAFSGRSLTISGNIVNNLDNNVTKNFILYYKNSERDSTYNTNGTPKIVWSGENDNKDAIGALAFSYYDTPSRFGTQISTANSYTTNNNPGGWFDFTLIYGSNTRAGVLADSFSSTTMRANDVSATNLSSQVTNSYAMNATRVSTTYINNTAVSNFIRGNGSITSVQTVTQVGNATGILYLI